jgi:hypothetical protein
MKSKSKTTSKSPQQCGNSCCDSVAEKTRKLAYSLWQKAGCPDGRDEEFWLQAEKQIKQD